MTLTQRLRASLSDAPDRRSLTAVVDDWRVRQSHGTVEDCVCGGQITAASRLDADIMAAVQRHQVEPRHIAYDQAQGIPWSDPQRRAAALDAVGIR